MIAKNKTILNIAALAVLTLLALSPTAPARESQWSQFGQASLSQADVQVARDKAKAALDATSEPEEKDSVEARLRTALERRISLLDELDSLLLRREELATALAENPKRLEVLQAEIAQLELADEPTAPETPTTSGFQALEVRGNLLRSKVEEAQGQIDAANKRLVKAAEMHASVAQRLAEAQQRQIDLESQLSIAVAGSPTRELLALQSANASLSARVAEQERLVLDQESQADSQLAEYRAMSLTAARLRMENHERERKLYEDSLQVSLQAEKARSEAELVAKEAEVTKAEDPFERFVARWEVDIARSESSRAEVEPFKVDVSTEVTEQEKRLANDRKEFERLRADVEESGISGAVGRAIRRVFSQMEQRRRAVEYAVKPYYESQAENFTDRRFEIDQLLYELDERWQIESEESIGAESLASDIGVERRKTARSLRDSLRASLQAERTALTEGINGLRQLRAVERERSQVLDELEKFIHAKVFWIQDQPALTGSILRQVPEEITQVADWAHQLGSRELEHLFLSPQPKPIALLFVLGVLFPLVAVFLTRRTRRFLSGENRSKGSLAARSVRIGAAGTLQCILPAACFVAAAELLPELELSREITAISVRLLFVLALFFLLRSVGRTFFGSNGIAVKLEWMPPEPSDAMRRLLRFVSAGILLVIVPWSVLSADFIEIEVIPRILVTSFGAFVGIASCRWFSGGSTVADFVVGDASSERTAKLRKAWTFFLVLGIAAALILSVSGRDLAARSLSIGLVKTVLTLLALAILYRVIIQLIERALKPAKRRRKRKSGAGDIQAEKEVSSSARTVQIRGIVRTVIFILGAWLIATYWGLNDQALGAMQTWELYTAGVDPVEGTQIWVTAGDVLYALVVLLTTVWFLRNLPGIYELTVFPRFNLDRGLRYAIVTISRYGLFFLGSMAALGALQVDFSNLAWLVAAMGIGLGFGLQEIVSNFVSGIILLLERPIRVGDMVTIGDVIGKIERINIRATTVVNLDRQEVIVPNRSLIAQNVTNWTLASKILRLIIHIGVAYGSDVEKVHAILSDVAQSDEGVLKDPPFQVFFMNHGDSSLDFELRVYIDDPDRRFHVTDRLNSAINKSLKEAGIVIPFPQRDVHLYSTSEPEMEEL